MFFLDENRLNFSTAGRPLYPRMFSEEQFHLRFGRLFNTDSCLYLLFSPGLGYGLSWLLTHPLPEASILAIFETDDALFPFYEDSDPVDIAAPKDLAYGIRKQHASWKKLGEELRTKHNIFFCPEKGIDSQLRWLRNCFFYSGEDSSLEDPSLEDPSFPKEGQRLINQLRRVRGLRFCGQAENADLLEDNATLFIQQNWQNHSTAIFMSHLWIKNALVNTLHNPETVPLSSLRGFLGTNPLILCGAGTELESTLEELRQHQNEGCTIAAVDTALPTLIESGIVPKLIFMLEAQFANLDDFLCSSVLRFLKESLLVYDILAYPPAVRLFAKRAAFISIFARTHFLTMLPEQIPGIPPLGSVGPAALYILLQHSKAPVYFCGFDFAFPRGRTHARSAPAHQRVLGNCTRLSPPAQWALEVPRHLHTEIGGKPALSDQIMQGYARSFAEILRLSGERSASELQHFRDEETTLPPPILKVTIPQPSGEYQKIIRRLRGDLLSLREKIAGLLQLAPPGELPESGEAGRLWEDIFQSLENHDFLWRFLPGQKVPEYGEEFLTALSKNMNYWNMYLQKLTAERSVIDPGSEVRTISDRSRQ